MFSNSTGFDQFGISFRKPVLQTNIRAYKYLQINFPFTLFLPKRFSLKEKDRYLTFKEIFEIGKKFLT